MVGRSAVCHSRGLAMCVSGKKRRSKVAAATAAAGQGAAGCGHREARTRREDLGPGAAGIQRPER